MEFCKNNLTEAKDSSNSTSAVFRAPLLWVFLPQVAAYILCGIGFSFRGESIAVAAVIALVCAVCAVIFASLEVLRGGKTVFSDAWRMFFPAAVFFLAGAWWSAEVPDVASWSGKPETELSAEIVVKNPFSSQGKSWSGIAVVSSASGAEELEGKRVYYQFSKSEFAETPHEKMCLRLRGIVKDVAERSWLNADFKESLIERRTGVMLFRCDNIEVSDSGVRGRFSAWCSAEKHRLISRFVTAGSEYERESRVLCAMLFGERQLLFADDKENFTITGTMHIFAVSGLHIALLAGMMLFALSRLRVPYLASAAVVIGVMWLYVQITGGAPSAQRAWMMIAFLIVGRLTGRRPYPLLAIILAASVSLWIEPELLEDLGFRLSYGVVTAILLYGVPLNKFIVDKWRPYALIPRESWTLRQRLTDGICRKVFGLLCISLSAFLAGTFFVMTSFEIFTPFSIVINLFLVPCAGILLGLAFASVVMSQIPLLGVVADLFWNVDCWITRGVEVFAALTAEIPAHLRIGFEKPLAGTLGGIFILVIFAFGEFCVSMRSRAILRFLLPPVFLVAYLVIFSE